MSRWKWIGLALRTRVDVVVLLVLMLLLLELVLVLLGAGGDVGIALEKTHTTRAATVGDDRLAVLSHDVDSDFLYQHERRDKAEEMR
jgi:hypothetical protein